MKKRKSLWRLWAKALGQKASKNDRESDYVAHIRSIIFLSYLITNLFIIAGVIRHWNDNQHYEVPSHLHQEQKETNSDFL